MTEAQMLIRRIVAELTLFEVFDAGLAWLDARLTSLVEDLTFGQGQCAKSVDGIIGSTRLVRTITPVEQFDAFSAPRTRPDIQKL